MPRPGDLSLNVRDAKVSKQNMRNKFIVCSCQVHKNILRYEERHIKTTQRHHVARTTYVSFEIAVKNVELRRV